MTLTDNDKTFGPITWGPSSSMKSLALCSYGERGARCGLYLNAFRRAFCLNLPPIMHWLRLRGEFGFTLLDGHLSIHYGPQTFDSATTKSWSCFLPWTQWQHIRTSLYGLKGELLCDEPRQYWAWSQLRDACPKVRFMIRDFDGTAIEAETHITEREWTFGTKWCRWLCLFRKNRIRRSLEIDFSAEVGPGKDSWKGGVLGHGIEMLPGELHEEAMRRYCDQELNHKGAKYRITFLGRLPEEGK